MISAEALSALENAFPGQIRVRRLSELTTWRIGGPAAVLEADSTAVLAEAMGVAAGLGLEPFILGRGSNLLASDEGFDGLVIRLAGSFRTIAWKRTGGGWRVEAGAAVMLPGLAGAACMKGAAGMDFAAGIPGTLGGAVFMNAGAYGASISDRILEIGVLDGPGVRMIPGEGCGFGYRTSRFQASGLTVVSTVLDLDEGDPAELKMAASAILERRRASFPLDLPNAGSVFRRADGAPPPGKLIEDAGMKGMRVGGAMISPVHANFIVNTGGASAMDVARLVRLVREAVENVSGVSLVEEVRLLGRFTEPAGGS